MTIDESIENLVLLKKLEDGLGNITGNTNSVTSQSLDKAIDVMRKYQKIEKLYKVYLKDLTTNIYADRKFIKALNEVLEDGSENNHHASNS